MTNKEIERHLECIGCPHAQALLKHLLQHVQGMQADKAEPEKDKSAKTTKTTKTKA